MKRIFAAALLVSLSAAAVASNAVAPVCISCVLGTPVPDPETRQALENYRLSTTFFTKFQSGDTVTICNATFCATYLYDGDYTNGSAVKRETHGGFSGGAEGGGSSAGGGGGSSGGGGDPIRGSGCRDGCCHCRPTVTVGG